MDKFTQIRQQIRNYRTRHLRTPPAVRGARSAYYRRGSLRVPAITLSAGGQFDTAARQTTKTRISKALSQPVDSLFFDLHTSVPDLEDFKTLARKQVVESFRADDFGNKVKAIFCNPVRSPWFELDILEVVGQAGEQLDAVYIPGCENADEVRDVQTILRNVQHAAGRRNRIFLEVLIDSPHAYTCLDEIAALEDVAALVFSPRFTRTMGTTVASQNWRTDLAAAREMLPIIAAAHGKVAIDAVARSVPQDPLDRDRILEQISVESRQSANQGYSGAWIEDIRAIEAVQNAWTPTRERALIALDIAVQYSEAKIRPALHPFLDHGMVVSEWPIVRAAYLAGVLSTDDFAQRSYTLPRLEHSIQA